MAVDNDARVRMGERSPDHPCPGYVLGLYRAVLLLAAGRVSTAAQPQRTGGQGRKQEDEQDFHIARVVGHHALEWCEIQRAIVMEQDRKYREAREPEGWNDPAKQRVGRW